MSYQTIVAAFDNAAQAQAAVEGLKAGGFHADDISAFDRNRVGLREPGLWQRMFGGALAQHEADVYSQSLQQGGMVVSVRVPDGEVAHATGILDIHRPIDVKTAPSPRALHRPPRSRPPPRRSPRLRLPPCRRSRCLPSWPRRSMKCCSSPKSSCRSASAWSKPA